MYDPKVETYEDAENLIRSSESTVEMLHDRYLSASKELVKAQQYLYRMKDTKDEDLTKEMISKIKFCTFIVEDIYESFEK